MTENKGTQFLFILFVCLYETVHFHKINLLLPNLTYIFHVIIYLSLNAFSLQYIFCFNFFFCQILSSFFFFFKENHNYFLFQSFTVFFRRDSKIFFTSVSQHIILYVSMCVYGGLFFYLSNDLAVWVNY